MYRNFQSYDFYQRFARAMDNRRAEDKVTIFPVNPERRTVSTNKKRMRAILAAFIAVSAPAYSASLVAELDPAIMFDIRYGAFNGQRLHIQCNTNCDSQGVPLRADMNRRRDSRDFISAPKNVKVTVTGYVGGPERIQNYDVNLTNFFCIVTWTLKKDGSISMRREMC
ncbi:MAG TPA: hypothetical protein PKD73_16990 [Burkholderiaceae bacterium]|nr:hypothetical protein [Burkholderiaceae bacterium]